MDLMDSPVLSAFCHTNTLCEVQKKTPDVLNTSIFEEFQKYLNKDRPT
jgi:inhibitor of KinA sporulation pathway (predicted exonuclease)